VAATSATYLDHAATTPMLPEAVAAMAEALTHTGNASSLHTAGRRARRDVEEARERIAASVGARPSEVVFTTGGTESDNLAVKGLFWARRDADPRRVRVLVSAIEHHAVLDAAHWLGTHEGAEVELLDVDHVGRVRPETLRAALAREPERAALVSVMWANNEVGTVNPVRELAAIAHEFGVPMHTDAVQAVGVLPVDFAASGVDALSLTGHKLGGPIGAGVLLLGREVVLTPLLHGGGQERDVRSGTLDTPAARSRARRPARRPRRPDHRRGAGRHRERRPGHRGRRGRAVAAARQRPPVVPRVRGRQPAHAARRPGHRVLHRIGVHRRGGPAQPRAPRDGRGRSHRPRLPAVLPRPHVHRRRRRRGRRRDRPGPRAGAACGEGGGAMSELASESCCSACAKRRPSLGEAER
jgi:hypothetical protein